MPETDPTPDVAALTVQLLSAYLANNTVASDDLADLIRTTRAALTEEEVAAEPVAEPETFTPAVSVRKSLASSSHIISLIDGKAYKTLKRHLSSHGLTPESYRSRYNLPATYPMVAPDYAAHRRAVAQKIGLGSRKPAAGADEAQELPALEASSPETAETAEAPAKPAGRGSKTAKPTRGGKPASSTRAKASKPEPAVSATEDASAEAASQPGGDDAPAPPAAKRGSSKTAKPKAATPGESAASEPTPADTSPAAAQPSDDGADASTPKRGRRKTASQPEAAPAGDANEDDGAAKSASKPASKNSSDKPRKAPRMARTPKQQSGTKGDTAD